MKELGFIDGEGMEITYPGPNEIGTSLVTQTKPGGPEASCDANATPEAGGGEEEQEDEAEATPVD